MVSGNEDGEEMWLCNGSEVRYKGEGGLRELSEVEEVCGCSGKGHHGGWQSALLGIMGAGSVLEQLTRLRWNPVQLGSMGVVKVDQT
ncbi:hypothetical protein V6N11_067840 [Hibiscus sabdariffa]|uniref:Uncharacterized protein n=1 Tax=Hibiscus sabdariffa TaxID=183260 RepID=A0ABR2SSK9_9ROSI